jgi:uncharacterized protein (UPF0254 family)
MRQALIDDIRNLYKCKVYAQLLQPDEAIKQLSEKFGVDVQKIKTIIKDCNL